ncbi:MAG: amino acid permease [Bacteroidales bacterium]|nr:amino acid permease [Bacteroidales bacterium]
MNLSQRKKLKKELGLFSVFAISTGAMFSSGFFLLPGLAAQYTGPSVFLAYFLSGLFIVPAMLSIAEITTAIPKAGGAYYIIDRTFGPMLGTVGGLGTYFALVLKSAFALIGIGAYSSLVFDIPIKPIAIMLTLIFAGIKILGAKKSSLIQNILVLLLLMVLGLIIADGLFQIFTRDPMLIHKNNFNSFFDQGMGGLFTTIGFVFVSYAGLTKIASVAEEIRNPERNIPRGMILSLAVTTLIYVLGTFLMVIFIPKESFTNDLTPVATLTDFTLRWLPAKITLIMVVFAAMAAFASTGNAGIMSSSRYPLAMARDKILPPVFGKVNKRFQVPVFSIIITSAMIILIILFVSEEGIAKMASAFQLLIFFFINLAVIVFRKSKIASYDPGFHSPLYPWMQIFGMFSAFILILYMGWVPSFFSLFLILISIAWYRYYVRKKTSREGAVYHWFALLGQHKYDKIENEFLHIIKEKGLREEDQFDKLITNASVKFVKQGFFNLKNITFEKLLERIIEEITQKHDLTRDELIDEFEKTSTFDSEFVLPQISISFASNQKIKKPAIHIAICEKGIRKKVSKHGINSTDKIHVFFFIIAPEENNRLLLRILARLMDITERDNFLKNLITTQNAREVKEYLLHNERYISLLLDSKNKLQQPLIDRKIKNIDFPKGILIALIERNNDIVAPDGETVLQQGDVLTIIGKPDALKLFRNKLKF